VIARKPALKRAVAGAPGRRVAAASDQRPVAIIGAGPYGLATAAHLRAAGVSVRVFGDVMSFWRRHMPRGMLLRSRLRSSHISHVGGKLTIEAFEADRGREVRRPSLTLEEFVDYGRWFQSRAVPQLEPRQVRLVEAEPDGFRLTLDDGEEFAAARVVVAAGLGPFGRWPAPLRGLPSETVSHVVDHHDLSGFEGRQVLVIGAGQSALESAALLKEAGAGVELAVRAPAVRWLEPGDAARRHRWPLPPTDVGGAVNAWLVAVPDVFRRLPARARPVVAYRAIRPAGADWLRARLEDVPMSTGRSVRSAQAQNGRVRLQFDDGSASVVDHIMLGTGYEVDVRRYPFLSEGVREGLHLAEGYPVLERGLESSVAGLHFVGASAAVAFGPIMRFVVGTWYAAPAVADVIAEARRVPLRPSYPRAREARGASRAPRPDSASRGRQPARPAGRPAPSSSKARMN
jgi:FAD-dependent urate hydroxylase